MTDVLVDFDLTYSVYFEEEGKVSFKYRKDTIGTEDITYGAFKFIIDGKTQLNDNNMDKLDWQEYTVDMITWGHHELTWRYTKLNIIPFTEFMEAEIESISIRGRHSNRLTQCYPCNLGYSEKGSSKCELCPENTYFYVSDDVNAHYCAPCPAQHFSPRGSVGEQSCK